MIEKTAAARYKLASEALIRAQKAASAKVASDIEPKSPVTAPDPTLKGTVAVPGEGEKGTQIPTLPTDARSKADTGNHFSTPSESQRQTETTEGAPAAGKVVNDGREGSPLNDKGVKTAGYAGFLSQAIKQASAKLAAEAGDKPHADEAEHKEIKAKAEEIKKEVEHEEAKHERSETDKMASDFGAVAFTKIAHEMAQSEEGRAMMQGWLKRAYSEKVASELFDKALICSNRIAEQEKAAAVAYHTEYRKQASMTPDQRDIYVKLASAHEAAIARLAQETVKVASELKLTNDEANILFLNKRAAYIKGAAAMGEQMEAMPEGQEGDLPPGAGESPQISPEDVVAVLQQLVQEGVISEEQAQQALQAYAQEQGGAQPEGEGQAPEGGQPEGQPAEQEAAPEGESDMEKEASAILKMAKTLDQSR